MLSQVWVLSECSSARQSQCVLVTPACCLLHPVTGTTPLEQLPDEHPAAAM
jgi:hypothetical protein